MPPSSQATASADTDRRPRRRWWPVGACGAVAAVLALYLIGALDPLKQQMASKLPARPQDALSEIVNVFTCCVLSWKALTTMVPAFFLGGAIAAFIPGSAILKYLGAGANKAAAYGVAAASGVILSLCSCNVVPLFVSIYRRGAGIGPAFAFLYAGPAINVVALVFTVQVLGLQLGAWRALGVPLIAVATGLLMALLFRRSEAEAAASPAAIPEEGPGSYGRVWVLVALLLGLVAYGAWEMAWTPKIIGMALILAAVVALMWTRFSGDEVKSWLGESWGLVKLTVPLLVPAVLVIGAASMFIDVKTVYRLVGPAPEGSTMWGAVQPVLLANVFSSAMYFPILSEVAFSKAFLKMGMGMGPALAILLTAAGTSIPGDLILWRAIGLKKALAYELVILVLTTAFALFFDSSVGQYMCACMLPE